MEVDKSLIDKELTEVQTQEVKEIKDLKKEQENEIRQDLGDISQLMPIVENLHDLALNKVLNMEVEQDTIKELSNCFIEILDKYLPKMDWVGKYSPEIAYLGLLGVAYLKSTQNKIKKEDEQIRLN